MTIQLTEPMQAFVDDQVGSGAYASAEEVIQAGLRRFQLQASEDARKLEQLMAEIQVGIDQIERGEFIEVTDIRAYLDEVMAEVEAEARSRAA